MKIYIEDGETYPAVQALQDGDAAPAGYSEVTDIETFYKYGKSSTNNLIEGWMDELAFRSKLKVMIYTKMQVTLPAHVDTQANWDLLNAGEKSIAAHYFIIGKESFLLEVNNDSRYWVIKAGEYRCWTQSDRRRRSEMCEAIIFMRMENLGDAKLTLAELNQITKDTVLDIDAVTNKLNGKAKVKRLNQMYIEGLEDEANDGVVAIKDWIQSTVGTPFENNGFMNLGFPFKTGHTVQSVADELMSILNGTF